MTMSSVGETAPSAAGEENIDDFDPDRRGSSANGWLRKVEAFAREHRLSEDQTYAFARGKLSAAAKQWLSSASKVSGWADFRQAIVMAFPGEAETGTTNRRTMDERMRPRARRTPRETVPDYVEAMVQWGQRLKLSEQAIVRCIVVGLRDPVLSRAIPRGMDLEQLRRALEWQGEVARLMEQYDASQVSVASFDRLADEMESFVLDGDAASLADGRLQLRGDDDVLKTVANELQSLVRQHRTALSWGLFDLGTSKTHQIVVHLVQDAALIDEPRLPPASTESQTHGGSSWQTSLISLLACDVIRKSSSSSTTSAHLLDSDELLLDLSHLNAICGREAPNLLLPQRLLSALAAFRYFTVLDFDGGHLQIPLAPDGPTRGYFSFRTPDGRATFEFVRAPRNFANTAIIFNKILVELARKLPPGDAVVLNDVLVLPALDNADGLRKLARVLPALVAFGLTASVRRSRLFLPAVQLFNWTVSHGSVILSGLPFEPSPSGGCRLTLAIKLSSDGATSEGWLRRTVGDSRTVGRFQGTLEASHRARDSLLAEHLANAIEHFRQFLLFAAFEVILGRDEKTTFLGGEAEAKQKLLRVQQFDFKLTFGKGFE